MFIRNESISIERPIQVCSERLTPEKRRSNVCIWEYQEVGTRIKRPDLVEWLDKEFGNPRSQNPKLVGSERVPQSRAAKGGLT